LWRQAGGAMLMEGTKMSNAAIPSYLEIVYCPSAAAQQRVAELIAREKEGGLSPEDKSELDHFMDLEHILRMAKGRARQILTSGS